MLGGPNTYKNVNQVFKNHPQGHVPLATAKKDIFWRSPTLYRPCIVPVCSMAVKRRLIHKNQLVLSIPACNSEHIFCLFEGRTLCRNMRSLRHAHSAFSSWRGIVNVQWWAFTFFIVKPFRRSVSQISFCEAMTPKSATSCDWRSSR